MHEAPGGLSKRLKTRRKWAFADLDAMRVDAVKIVLKLEGQTAVW
jgi:hypothetical protein